MSRVLPEEFLVADEFVLDEESEWVTEQPNIAHHESMRAFKDSEDERVWALCWVRLPVKRPTVEARLRELLAPHGLTFAMPFPPVRSFHARRSWGQKPHEYAVSDNHPWPTHAQLDDETFTKALVDALVSETEKRRCSSFAS